MRATVSSHLGVARGVRQGEGSQSVSGQQTLRQCGSLDGAEKVSGPDHREEEADGQE